MSANAMATALVTPSPGTWVVDPSASTATFRVRNFGVRQVHGSMAVTSGRVRVDDEGLPQRAEGRVDVSTIRTGNRRRDADLCGRRFLDVAGFPEMRLVVTRIEAREDGWTAAASLHVRDVPSPITLRIRALDDGAEQGRRVELSGVLDLRTTPIRVPRAVVGRYVEIRVEALLTATTDQSSRVAGPHPA